MAKYKIKFSPSDVAYNYEIEAENETEAENIGREILVNNMGYDASRAWNCTDIIKYKNSKKLNKVQLEMLFKELKFVDKRILDARNY